MHDYNQYVTAINKIFDYIEKMKAGWDNQDNMNYIEKIEAFQTTVTGCASEFKKPPSHIEEEEEVVEQPEEVTEDTIEEPQTEGEEKEEIKEEEKVEETVEEKKEEENSPLPAIQAGTAPIAEETPTPTTETEQAAPQETQEGQAEPTAIELPEAPEVPPVLPQPAEQQVTVPVVDQTTQPAGQDVTTPAPEQPASPTEEAAAQTPTPTEATQAEGTTQEVPATTSQPAAPTEGLKPVIPAIVSSDSSIQIPSQISLNPPDMPTPQLPADSPIPSIVTNHVEEKKEPETTEMDEQSLVEETGATSVVAG